MAEYMKKTARKDAQQNNASPVQAKTNGIPNSVLNDVFAGKRHADSSMMGHSQNLAPSIAAKMSRAFGMDLTGMQVYQSDAMKGTGMQGMAQGNKVVLSSDVDLNTTAGQAVLGHEISHIHAQSQGIGMGHSGLYENAALEHQADTEGLLAAQGRSIYSDGMDTGIGMQYGLGMRGVEGLTPLGSGMSANAGAPMQAWKFTDLFKKSNPDKEAGKAKNPKNAKQARAFAYIYAKKLADENFYNKYGTNKTGKGNLLEDDEKKINNFKKTSAKKMGSVISGLHGRLKDFVENMPVPESERTKMRDQVMRVAGFYPKFNSNEKLKNEFVRNKVSEREKLYKEDILDGIIDRPISDNLSRYDFKGTSLQTEMDNLAMTSDTVSSPFRDMHERLASKIDEKYGNEKLKNIIDSEEISGNVEKVSPAKVLNRQDDNGAGIFEQEYLKI